MTFGSVFGVRNAPRWIVALGLLLATAMPALAQCPLSIAAAANYAVGTRPQSVAVGDFNADGRPDLAVANEGSNNLSILLGNANGTFQPPVNYAVGTNSTSVAVGDFNADGQPDLAVTNSGNNNVSILLGNGGGSGTFQAAVNYAVGLIPRSVAVGDFNADGLPDLAVANNNTSNVSILLGNGNGTFQAAVNYAAGSTPRSIAVGDFNADGRPDLAVANFGSNTVSILLGNANGTFQAAVNYAAGSFPFSVAVGDFNADGRPDLAVANSNSNNVSILLGNANGTFQAAVNYAAGRAVSVAVGDFNADGRPDLAVANFDSNNVSVLLNTTPNGVVVSQQPASVSICPSGTATFSVTASGTTPAYQWQWQPAGPNTAWVALSNGVNNNNQAIPTFNVSGATTPSMNITSISGLGGNFRCLVTTACGSVTSNEATLTITSCCPADFNADGTLDPDDLADYIGAYFAQPEGAGSDFNADGTTDPDDLADFIGAFFAGC